MPAITTPNSTVLVTGANGFIATWLVGDLLTRGYTVRAAVRSEAKGRHLLKAYEEYVQQDKLAIFEIGGDMAKVGTRSDFG